MDILEIRLERIKILIERGYTGDINCGIVYNRWGKEIKSTDSHGYLIISTRINNISFIIKQHQFIWYLVHKEVIDEIDHINGIRNDNRINNLRSITRTNNQRNRHYSKGYYFDKQANKWKVTITINGKTKHIGYFDTEDKAHQAYLDAKKIYHII